MSERISGKLKVGDVVTFGEVLLVLQHPVLGGCPKAGKLTYQAVTLEAPVKATVNSVSGTHPSYKLTGFDNRDFVNQVIGKLKEPSCDECLEPYGYHSLAARDYGSLLY